MANSRFTVINFQFTVINSQFMLINSQFIVINWQFTRQYFFMGWQQAAYQSVSVT